MKAEPPASLLKLATIFIPATLGAFLVVAGMIWLLDFWVTSVIRTLWDRD